MDERLETARLMARFKLCLRRSLQSSVDLQKMVQDRDYPEQMLRDTEDKADNEELLVLTLQLRDALFPRLMQPAHAVRTETSALQQVVIPAITPAENGQTRNYKFGARSW